MENFRKNNPRYINTNYPQLFTIADAKEEILVIRQINMLKLF